MPPQPFACSLKLPKRKGGEVRSEKKGRKENKSEERKERCTRRERDQRRCRHTHTNTESCRQTHGQTNVGRQHSAGFSGPLNFLASQQRFTLPNGVHCSPDLGSGEKLSFPQNRLPPSTSAGLGLMPARSPLYRRFSRGLGCLPARPLASALRRLVPPL